MSGRGDLRGCHVGGSCIAFYDLILIYSKVPFALNRCGIAALNLPAVDDRNMVDDSLVILTAIDSWPYLTMFSVKTAIPSHHSHPRYMYPL